MTTQTEFIRRDPAEIEPWAETCGSIRCLIEESDKAAGEVHYVEIEDAKLHYHRRLTETASFRVRQAPSMERWSGHSDGKMVRSLGLAGDPFRRKLADLGRIGVERAAQRCSDLCGPLE